MSLGNDCFHARVKNKPIQEPSRLSSFSTVSLKSFGNCMLYFFFASKQSEENLKEISFGNSQPRCSVRVSISKYRIGTYNL
jgi:hypothetical protein